MRRSGAEAWSVDWIDESHVAACSRDGGVWLCSLDEGPADRVHLLGFHGRTSATTSAHRPALGVASLGAGLLASCGDDGVVCVWDLAARQVTEVFASHETEAEPEPFSGVRSILSLGTGRIVSCGGDRTARVWEIGGKEPVAQLSTPEGLRDLAVMPDGRVAYCGDDGLIGVWNYATGADHRRAPANSQLSKQDFRKIPHHVGNVMAIVALGDGRLVTAGQDRTIRVWDSSSLERIGAPMTGHLSRVRWLAPHGVDHVVSAGDDGTVRIWSVDSAREVACLRGHRDWVKCVASSPSRRVASCDEAGEVRIWSPDLSKPRPPAKGHLSWTLAVAPTQAGQVITAGEDGKIKWWDCSSGAELRTVAVHDDWIRDVTVVPSMGVVTCSEDRTARLIPEGEDQASRSLQAPSPLWTLDHVGSDVILFGGRRGLLGTWHVGTGEARLFSPLDGDVRVVRRIAEARAVAATSAGSSSLGQLWDTNTDGRSTLLLTTGVRDLRMIAVDGGRVAVGGRGAEVWDVDSRSLVTRIDDGLGLIRGLEWLSREIVVLADDAGAVWLLRVPDGAVLATHAFNCGFTQVTVDHPTMTVALAGSLPEPLLLKATDQSNA